MNASGVLYWTSKLIHFRQLSTSFPQLVQPGNRFLANNSKQCGFSGKYCASISTQHSKQHVIALNVHIYIPVLDRPSNKLETTTGS